MQYTEKHKQIWKYNRQEHNNTITQDVSGETQTREKTQQTFLEKFFQYEDSTAITKP